MSAHTTKSNLLVIMDDEHSPKALGCNGRSMAITPNLDRLAAAGTWFRNAYTPSPLCVPARACLATGLPVRENLCWDNAIAYGGQHASWGHRLQAAGRRTAAVGKLHFTDVSASTGFDEQFVPMHLYADGDLHGSLRDPLPVRYQSRSIVDRIGGGETEYTEYDRKIAELAQQWLRERAGERGGPWALFVSFICPHYPLVAPQAFYDLYPIERIPLPKRRIEPWHPKSDWWAEFERSYVFEQSFANDTQRRAAIAAYYGMVSFVDDLVGKVLATLHECALAPDTTVLFTSDHGDNLGARGLWGKSTFYEEAAGIPMLLAGPGVPAGRVARTPVSLLDVYPTALDCAGIAAGPEDAGRPGISLRERAAEDDPDRVVVSEYHGAGATTGAFMLRTGRWKYIHLVGHGAELYDLENDPEELYDLALRADYRARVQQLEARLRALLDPEAVDAHAKRDQAALVARHGGREAILRLGGVNATPVPGRPGIFVAG